MRLRRFSLTLFLVFAAPVAHAGFLVEPYVKYEMGAFKSTLTTSTTSNYDQSGIGFGGRLGYDVLLLMTALDYSMCPSLNMRSNSSGVGSTTATENQLFIDVGVNLLLIRAYAGYGLTNALDIKMATGDETFNGSAIKVGLSWTALPILAVNFEYIGSTFNKEHSHAGYTEMSGNSYSIGVSAPFDF